MQWHCVDACAPITRSVCMLKWDVSFFFFFLQTSPKIGRWSTRQGKRKKSRSENRCCLGLREGLFFYCYYSPLPILFFNFSVRGKREDTALLRFLLSAMIIEEVVCWQADHLSSSFPQYQNPRLFAFPPPCRLFTNSEANLWKDVARYDGN